jgi:dsDNA-specific endonuclease/ATPase MutS2
MYDFVNAKLEGMNGTYSSKIEMLSNFMMQAQDEIRDLKTVKNDSSFRLEDIKTLIDQRDKVVRDKIQETSHQVVHLSSSLKD